MDIAQHSDQPIQIDICGKSFGFSEFRLADLGELQQWVKDHTPHPIEAVKPHLAGLPDSDRAALLNDARRDALRWPPQVGTAAGAAALLGTEDGQVETLWVALRIHQTDTTRVGAAKLYRRLRTDPDKAQRIYAIAFGMEELLGGPKA